MKLVLAAIMIAVAGCLSSRNHDKIRFYDNCKCDCDEIEVTPTFEYPQHYYMPEADDEDTETITL